MRALQELDDRLARQRRLLGTVDDAEPAFANLFLEDEAAEGPTPEPCVLEVGADRHRRILPPPPPGIGAGVGLPRW
jgi:hypothetical protein